MKKYKGADEIERDFYQMFLNSDLSKLINGNVYRAGTRPMGAMTEDAVISFKAGLGGQFQSGEVAINIYVPMIDGTIKNIARCNEIGSKIEEIVDTWTSSEYRVRMLNIPQSYEELEIKQHFVNARIRFIRNNA